MRLRERLPEVVAGAVRVPVEPGERLPERLQHAGRRREGVLVRRQLDRPRDAELPLELLDGLAGLVRMDVQDRLVGQALPGGAHVARLTPAPGTTREP